MVTRLASGVSCMRPPSRYGPVDIYQVHASLRKVQDRRETPKHGYDDLSMVGRQKGFVPRGEKRPPPVLPVFVAYFFPLTMRLGMVCFNICAASMALYSLAASWSVEVARQKSCG